MRVPQCVAAMLLILPSLAIHGDSAADIVKLGTDISLEEAKNDVKKLINSQPIVMFSKSTCPYCRKAKDIWYELGLQPLVVELNRMPKGAIYQKALGELTGRTTVPNIFIGQSPIGGYDELHALFESEELFDIFDAVGIEPPAEPLESMIEAVGAE